MTEADHIRALCDQLHPSLKQIPDLIGELRGKLEPGRDGDGGRSAPGAKPNAPLQLSPVDDADDLYAALREHAACIADTLGTKPPKTVGRTVGGEKGLPANTPPETAFGQARTLSVFIEHQLPTVRDEDLVADIVEDILKRWNVINNRYPTKAPKQHVPIRCPHCEVMLVYMHGPRSFGFDETFVCDNCGLWMTEQEVAEQRLQQTKEAKARGKAS